MSFLAVLKFQIPRLGINSPKNLAFVSTSLSSRHGKCRQREPLPRLRRRSSRLSAQLLRSFPFSSSPFHELPPPQMPCSCLQAAVVALPPRPARRRRRSHVSSCHRWRPERRAVRGVGALQPHPSGSDSRRCCLRSCRFEENSADLPASTLCRA